MALLIFCAKDLAGLGIDQVRLEASEASYLLIGVIIVLTDIVNRPGLDGPA